MLTQFATWLSLLLRLCANSRQLLALAIKQSKLQTNLILSGIDNDQICLMLKPG